MSLLLLLVAVPVHAQTPARHTRVSLVAEKDAVQPGRPLTVGIRLQMEPGWHTYWRNPGDTGLPTRVRWTLPAGFEAGEIQWPHPIVFVAGPLASYGYEHEVLLPVELRAPASLSGQEATIGARVDWLECKDVCLPGKVELSLRLPVRPESRPASDAAAFAEARRRLPAADPAWRVSATSEGSSVVLTFAPPRGTAVSKAQFFPITRSLLDYARPQTLERNRTGHRLVVARDPNAASVDRLTGVLVVESGGESRALAVDTPLAVASGRPGPRR